MVEHLRLPVPQTQNLIFFRLLLLRAMINVFNIRLSKSLNQLGRGLASGQSLERCIVLECLSVSRLTEVLFAGQGRGQLDVQVFLLLVLGCLDKGGAPATGNHAGKVELQKSS